MQINSCPFCESEDVELITGKGKFDRVRCKSCGATGPWYDGHPEDAVADWNAVCPLTSRSSRAAGACACKSGGWFDFNDICITCGGTKPPPA